MSTRAPLRILKITSSYPRSQDDSASVFLRYLARGLHERGLGIHVLAPADQGAGTVIEDGIGVTRFRYLPRRLRRLAYGSGILPNLRRNPMLWLSVPFYLVGMFSATIFLILRLRPDILHAHWILPQGVVAVVAGRLLGVPTVTSAHGGDAFAFRRGPGAWLKRLALRLTSAWTANTQATARMAAAGEKLPPAHVIPMGVDVAHFAAGRRAASPQAAEGSSVVLFVGRLVDKKGVDDLINAFAQLGPERLSCTRLWIVGEGDCRPTLERLAQKHGLLEKITFWGRVPNEKLPYFYGSASLFVAPSVVTDSGDTEGQGVVFLEAFAARLPVIATDVGGIAEIVRHNDTGWLVAPRRPDALAAAMEVLLKDSGLRSRLADNAFSEVSERYDWRIAAERFEKLYLQIAGRC